MEGELGKRACHEMTSDVEGKGGMGNGTHIMLGKMDRKPVIENLPFETSLDWESNQLGGRKTAGREYQRDITTKKILGASNNFMRKLWGGVHQP